MIDLNKEYTYAVTKDWLLMYSTEKGAWSAKQLACLGISWPPSKGWINRVIGTTIVVSKKERFEHLAREPAKDKVNIQDQERRIIQLERKLEELTASFCNINHK